MIGGTVIFYMNIRQEEHAGEEDIVGAGFAPALNTLCHQCGASNISIARFCATCGTPLNNPQVIIKGQ